MKRIILGIFLLPLAGTSISQTVGKQYFENYLKAEYYTHWDERENMDSALYYYDKALESGAYFETHHLQMLINTLLFNRSEHTRKYMELGIPKGLSWKEMNNLMKTCRFVCKNTLKYRGKTYPFNTKLKLTDFISKKWYKENYVQPMIGSVWAKKQLVRALKTDQHNNRALNTKKDSLAMNKNDSLTYLLVKKVIDSLGRIPTVEDIGEKYYDEFSLFIVHMKADYLMHILPDLIKAINNGTYYDNEAVAYTIERNALGFGEYILLNDTNFSIFTDTTSYVHLHPKYSYLGAMASGITDPDLMYLREILYIRPTHPDISILQVNHLRSKLCLEPIEIYLQQNKVAVIDIDGNVLPFRD